METTHKQRMAVRRDECRMSGHDFDVVAVVNSPDPRAVVCTNCGDYWEVKPRPA